ncbi:MAG TPA: glycosyltransferase [Verrucomicrobiae bacterium]|jgi:processive 1,2-diacylglycerol beta-glucosyltransferase|nr:glycosyltransferase [Verrucomicrobiae bacterium]
MRIFIATVTAGGGHNAAAAALEEAWRALRPDDTVERVDLLKFFSPLHKKIYADGYVKFVEHAPELWGMLFSKTDSPKLVRGFAKWSRAFPSASRTKFKKYLQAFRPDAVLCTHFLPHELLGMPRKNVKAPQPFVTTVVTDFEAHALWMDSSVDLYCVAADETKARLVARGVPPENIVVTGIPVSSKFSSKPDPKAVRKAYGLRDDLPVMLVLGGGFGMGPLAEILAELDKAAGQFQIVVVVGRNEKLRGKLAARDHKHPTRVLGFTTNMHELMAIAELIITKPGGLTTSEALAMGKPLFILNPIPGQEAANSDFLLERGAAAKANRVEDLPFRVEQLTGSKKLSEMARAAKAIGRPQAAQAICGEVLLRTTPH